MMGEEPEPYSQLILTRYVFTDTSTIGTLSVERDIFKSSTLEDTCHRDKNNDGILQKEEKVMHKTAIPQGRYRVILANSPHFGFVPHLLNVPHFTNILIHSGNTADDSSGCIIVGKYHPPNDQWIGESRITLHALMDILKPLNEKEELWIQINGGLRAKEII